MRSVHADELCVEGRAGEGSSGPLPLVRERSTGRLFVRKPSGAATGLRELLLLSRIRHPNILGLEAVGEEAGRRFLLLDHAEGGDLAAWLQGRPRGEVPRLLSEALRGLAYLHANGVVHGDLKPGNLLVFSDGRLVVADFDLSRGDGAVESGGTPAFMAPERLQGRGAGPAGDLYGLAAAFAVALGAPPPRRPLDGPETYASFLRQVPDLGPVRALLLAMIEAAPAARPASAIAAARQLARLAGEPSFGLDSPASARAWLHPFEVLGREEIFERLTQLGPAVTVLRSAPQMGGTRLLEVLAAETGAGLLNGATASLRDLEGSGGVVLLDEGDLASDRLMDRLVEIQRLALDESVPRVLVLLRPGSVLDSRLAAEGVRVVDLPPLDSSSIVTLVVRAFTGRGGAEALGRMLHERCGGAPGRVVAALAALHSCGRVVPGAFDPSDLPEPEELAGEIGGPLSSVMAAAFAPVLVGAGRALASLAACARRPLPRALIREAAGALAVLPEELEEAARTLLDAGLLAEGEHFVTAGTAAREALCALLSPPERVAAHRALADALEVAGDDEPALLRAADRAWHLVQAGDARGVDLACEVAPKLLGRSLSREVRTLLEAIPSPSNVQRLVLARAQAMTGDCLPALETARAAGRDGAGLAVEVLIRLGDYAAAIREAEAIAEGDAALDALHARALALSGAHAEALEVCERALAQNPPSAEGADLAATAALAQFYLGALDAAAARYEEAARFARQAGDRGREANAVNGLGLVAQRRAHFDAARDFYARALSLAEVSGDRARQGTCHLNLGTVLQEIGRSKEAAASYRRSARIAHLLGERVQSARARSNLANLLLYLGRTDDARREAEFTVTLARGAGAGVVAAYGVLLTGEAALWASDFDAARRSLGEARAAFGAMGNISEAIEASLLLGRTFLAEGDVDSARCAATEAISEALRRSLDRHEAQGWLLLGEAALLGSQGKLDALAAAHRALGLMLAAPRPDWTWRAEAVLALASTDEEAGRHHAARALRMFSEAAAAVDAEDRETFLSRPDRSALRSALLPLSSTSPARSDPRLARLLSINRRLGAERNLKSLLDGIVDEAVTLCGAERGFVLLKPQRPTAGISVMVARNADGESIARGQLKVSHTIAERVIELAEPELTLDAQEDERYQGQHSVAALRLRSVVCVPLRFHGQALGALYVDNRFRARAFGEDDLALLEAFAGQAAIALAQVRALEEARLAREEADAARKEIEQLNQRLREQVEVQEAELLRARREAEEQRRLVAHTGRFTEIVGESEPMQRLLRQLERVAETDLSVLVTGESGTGKELVARALFSHGARKERPFVSINCAALAEGLLESELFGHVRGAFTGADRDKQGLFEIADGGTLFLDEVGDMGPAMQVKLLRALQEGEIRRVGGREPVKVDVRVIAATNRNLGRMMREGTFREDLYYRLNVVSLHLPPLRERRDDLPALCARLLSELSPRDGRPYRLAADALQLLSRYAWPGNIRELRATLHNAALFAESTLLTAADFAHKEELKRDPSPATLGGDLLAGRPIEQIEAEAIRRTLEFTGGNKAETARLLGIDRKTLYNKLARLRIDAA